MLLLLLFFVCFVLFALYAVSVCIPFSPMFCFFIFLFLNWMISQFAFDGQFFCWAILLTWPWTPFHHYWCWCRSFLRYFGGSSGSSSRCSTTRTNLSLRRSFDVWRCWANRLRSICFVNEKEKEKLISLQFFLIFVDLCGGAFSVHMNQFFHRLDTYFVLLSSSACYAFVEIPFVGYHAVIQRFFSGCHVVNCSFRLLLISEWLA